MSDSDSDFILDLDQAPAGVQQLPVVSTCRPKSCTISFFIFVGFLIQSEKLYHNLGNLIRCYTIQRTRLRVDGPKVTQKG